MVNSSSKSPELLAKYCDSLLKKSSKNPEEAELEDTLNQVVSCLHKYCFPHKLSYSKVKTGAPVSLTGQRVCIFLFPYRLGQTPLIVVVVNNMKFLSYV